MIREVRRKKIMKMKKLAAFALASMLVVTSLTGCGGSNDKGSNSKAKTDGGGFFICKVTRIFL